MLTPAIRLQSLRYLATWNSGLKPIVEITSQGESFNSHVYIKVLMREGVMRFFLVVLLALAPLTTLINPASAGSSGGIEASVEGVGFMPPAPVMGGSVTITLTLHNSNPTTAYNVEYAFYKNSIESGNDIKIDVIDIPGNGYIDVSAVWNSLQEGPQKIWLDVEFNGDTPVQFHKGFNVSGLANLEVTLIEVSPSSGLIIGDTGNISTTVTNSGTVASGNSTLQIGIQGIANSSVDVAVPPLAPGQSVSVNASLAFPESGTWTLTATPDAYDEVSEVAEGYGGSTLAVEVLPLPDYYFTGQLLITSPSENLDGPWTISGTLARSYGVGNQTARVDFSVVTSGQQTAPAIAPLEVMFSDEVGSSQPFSHELDAELQGLAVGEYALTATVDPLGWLEQSNSANDQITGLLNIRPIPNVQVDPASPSSMIVNSGDKVNWYVLLTNTGDISVSGRLNYSWEGQENILSAIINIGPFSSQPWSDNLSTGQGAHTATFSAKWEPLSNSYDSDTSDSETSVSITVSDTLSLTFQPSTGELATNTAAGALAHAPLKYGSTYAYTITLTSSGEGNETLVCSDGGGAELGQTSVSIANSESATVTCIFNIEQTTPYSINIVASSGTAPTHSRTWQVSSAGTNFESDDQSFGNLAVILGFSTVAFVGILIASLVLTRERDEEIERDIFDYCPACDGEIEGEEKLCSHCSFNLARARRRFHDCATCNENIPSMISHCPFCGAEQDLSIHFEQRERRETKALPDEDAAEDAAESGIDDDDVIVTGTKDFDSAIEEFGYDAGQLESDWDEKFAAAEAEMEALSERLEIEEEIEEGEEDVAEPMLKTSTETFAGEGFADVLDGREDLISIEDKGDDSAELSASDAEIRKQLYDITGEEGVLPGEEVIIGMGVSDRGLAGNELPEDAMDFSFEDDELTPASIKQKRAVRRRKTTDEMGECGACGADIPMDADECDVCGARYD
jgi:hypothetical protein